MMEVLRRFRVSLLRPGDRILLIASTLLLADSFLSWQRLCGGSKAVHLSVCLIHANEWGGAAPLVGILAAMCNVALLAWKVTQVMDVDLGLRLSPRDAGKLLVLGTVLFTVLKFVVVMGRAQAYGAWIGLMLAAAVAVGGYIQMRDQPVVRQAAGAGFTE